MTEAKEHLEVETSDWDDLIESLIGAARESAEHFTDRHFVQKRVVQYFDSFPSGGSPIELGFAPVREVKTVQYVDEDGVTQTWASSNYLADLSDGMPPRITEAYGINWPSIRDQANSVIVTYDIGPKSLSDIPKSVKAAIKLQVGAMFENREDPAQEKIRASQNLLQVSKRTFL